MYKAIARNKRNTVFIMVLFVLLVAAIGFAVNLIWGDPLGTGDWTVTIATMIGVGIYVVIQYFAGSSQALAMSGARQIQKADNPRLYRVVENLAITKGLPMPKVYIVDDPSPNAFATGRKPELASVAATTGLLDMMTDSELEGVMAHEMGHVENYDIRLNTIVFALVVAIGFIVDILMRMMWFGGGRRSNNNNGGNPIMLIVGLAALVLSPIIAALIQAAISRQREYLADATGAMTTRHPEALASALEKLGQYGKPLQKQNSTMAHMWFGDPSKPGVMDRLFGTHPPIGDRVKRLLGNATRF
ncbi:heat shock protein HtpX [Cryobacterium mesophilum]|uniref:Protease HtpX homolog n=1 Tax=Terrimesophilobacter mesophilus TaxID=433647 RepID=A0A4R8VD95_9MICO|nr:M48 family metalloprotease [Terrimesophilobacter mesophilus]MBB5633765.1 heat shock protein HtpX [Terrimesophilobacter mesophilus]TFB80446.1 protease [Terrimesophilobacter mesophilus]